MSIANKTTYTYRGKTRIYWIDWIKAINITLLVWSHITPVGEKEIFLFHMPLFFMISGMLYKQKGSKEEFKSSVQTLLLPYIIYNILYLSPLPLGGGKKF